ncbi:hypothetical protein NG697_20225 [Pseudarthrobacter sp. MDT3-26]|uniref:hypothetical protein n=1 Tax=Pseudarthrobacter raffinosi TaxID=2953651 RepID=UPI00208DFD83|nr:hypothetical protein [Pseudarthrobacter sp. MDT3-26]MCO4265206.1 hypothetical protein [Pseudarthrobacter sp. MDT3-26]
MRVSASWLHSGLRALVLGALLAAAWIIFGAASAHASEPLPPLTDAVYEVTGNEAAPSSSAQMSGATAEKTGPPEGPVAALLEPAVSIAEPLAAPAQQIVDPVLVPLDAALAPAAAPVTAVIGQIAQVAEPLTGLATDAPSPVTLRVADIAAPVTGVLADVVAPVTAAVGPAISTVTVVLSDEDITAALPAPSAALEAVNGASNDAPGGASATAAPVLSENPSAVRGAGNERRLVQDQAAFPVTTAPSNSSEMQTQDPAPDFPNRPGQGWPATVPAGPGSSFRAAGEAGSAFADELAGFQLSLTRSSPTDAIRGSDDLPGSVSLEHGFSPD